MRIIYKNSDFVFHVQDSLNFTLASDARSFSLEFKGKIVLTHSQTNPCIKLAHASPDFKMHKRFVAYHKIKNPVMEKTPLLNVERVSSEDQGDVLSLIFDQTLKLDISVNEGRLHLEPQLLTGEFNHFTLTLPALKEEAIYGCGEQFSFLNLRGRTVPLWTQEPGIAKKKLSLVKILADLAIGAGGEWWTTYYPQPTFISSENYFVHVDSYAYGELDFEARKTHEVRMNEIPERIVIDVADTAPGVLGSLSAYLGRQRPLPDWALEGVWLGIIGGLDEKDPLSVPAKLKKAKGANTKVAAIWAEDWSGLRHFKAQTRLFWNWKYDPELYKDLPQYIETLHEEGIRFLGYNNCFLMDGCPMYEEAEAKGYFVKNEEGEPYLLRMFSFYAPMLDLTNPDACTWMKEIIKEHMIGANLDGWMADFGEYIPIDAKLANGKDPYLHHNEYPVLWAKLNAEAVQEMGRDKGENAIVFFSRSGNYGSTRYSPLIWAGDQATRFWLEMGLAAQIVSAVSLGLLGVGFAHGDIAGYFHMGFIKRTKELYMRGTELATFTVVMRTHESKGHAGWAWYTDAETLDHFAKFSRIHAALKPYFKTLIQEYVETGLPVVRHPYLHYENDPTFHQQKPRLLQYQFLLGSEMLVAPVYQKGKTTRKLYLPAKKWIHLWSGKEYTGGWVTVDAPLAEPPVFYRKGTEFASLFETLKEV